MKPFLLLLAILFTASTLSAQTTTTKTIRFKVTDQTVVKDVTGRVLSTEVWKAYTETGDFTLRPENINDENTAFVLTKLTPEQKQKRLEQAIARKPTESKFFTTGQTIDPFRVRDITGKKILKEDWAGKTVVLNFWFIGCPPCRREMPELNKLVEKYKGNPNVIFIGIALDQSWDIKDFIKTKPFDYQLVADGRAYAQQFGINSYPTNLVINKEGKVQFHSTGYSEGVPHWIDKTIAESEAGK